MKRLIYASTLLAVLAGCTTLKPVAGPQADWQARQEQLQALSRWELKARIAVRYESDGGQGNMNWKQDGAQSRIVLSGPFGTGAYRITWNPESMEQAFRIFSRLYSSFWA